METDKSEDLGPYSKALWEYTKADPEEKDNYYTFLPLTTLLERVTKNIPNLPPFPEMAKVQGVMLPVKLTPEECSSYKPHFSWDTIPTTPYKGDPARYKWRNDLLDRIVREYTEIFVERRRKRGISTEVSNGN